MARKADDIGRKSDDTILLVDTVNRYERLARAAPRSSSVPLELALYLSGHSVLRSYAGNMCAYVSHTHRDNERD